MLLVAAKMKCVYLTDNLPLLRYSDLLNTLTGSQEQFIIIIFLYITIFDI